MGAGEGVGEEGGEGISEGGLLVTGASLVVEGEEGGEVV